MNQFFNQTYKNKKVLVTGHTGFKGSWLSFWLELLGAEVVGISLAPNIEPNLYGVLGIKKHITSIFADIRDKNNLEKIIIEQKPDFIFHLAAQSLVRYSYQEPYQTFETNIMGTVNLFEAVRKCCLKCVIINVTSDKCYENNGAVCNFKETDSMGGFDPYSASKGASEIVTGAYRNSFFNPRDYGISHKVALASARAGNVIGGGDWSEDRLIPDIIRHLVKKEEVIIRNPHSVRPWQHVIDCVSGYMLLGAKLSENAVEFVGSWNFGPDENIVMTVEQILLKSLKLWGTGNYKVIPEKVLKEANFLRLNISKAKKELGWKPRYEIDKALEKTINWYKNYYSGMIDMYEYTKNEIKEYSDCKIADKS